MPELVTFLTALIAGALSLVAITLSKEQKISEFRQAWIDALRNDLADFLSSAHSFARAMEARGQRGSESGDPAKSPFTLENLGEIRHTAAQTKYRIQLRLNPDEFEHNELLRLLTRITDLQNESLDSKSFEPSEILAAVDRAVEFAGPVLKTEWNRVKMGEKPYRLIRILATITVIVALIAFAFFWIEEKTG